LKNGCLLSSSASPSPPLKRFCGAFTSSHEIKSDASGDISCGIRGFAVSIRCCRRSLYCLFPLSLKGWSPAKSSHARMPVLHQSAAPRIHFLKTLFPRTAHVWLLPRTSRDGLLPRTLSCYICNWCYIAMAQTA
jgi:hypothetical protein